MADASSKICVICGESCAYKPRTKDKKGRYYCTTCYEAALKEKRAATAPTPPPVTQSMNDDHDSLMYELLDGDSGPSSEPMNCPDCGEMMPPNAVICVNCGYNAHSGAHVETHTFSAPAGTAYEPTRRPGSIVSEGFFSTTLGMITATTLFTLAFVPFIMLGNEVIAWGAVFVWIIAALVIGVCALVDAFQNSILHGIAYLFVPVYSLIYMIIFCMSYRLKVVYWTFTFASIIVFIAMTYRLGTDLTSDLGELGTMNSSAGF